MKFFERSGLGMAEHAGVSLEVPILDVEWEELARDLDCLSTPDPRYRVESGSSDACRASTSVGHRQQAKG